MKLDLRFATLTRTKNKAPKTKTIQIKDKICLDIGCNIGTLTMRLAQEYKPKMIIGIDIDYKLIKAALDAS